MHITFGLEQFKLNLHLLFLATEVDAANYIFPKVLAVRG